uniref:Sialin n=1 Tax=Trichuris muris TaxID=70415 RepID=A0A5S6Q5Z9_TRIMR
MPSKRVFPLHLAQETNAVQRQEDIAMPKELEMSEKQNGVLSGGSSLDNTFCQRTKYGFGWRHIVAFLGTFGFMTNYLIIFNLSVTIVSMVNNTALEDQSWQKLENLTNGTIPFSPSVCAAPNQTSVDKDGPFLWSRRQMGIVLGSFYYGYIWTQMPGGLLSAKFGGKWIFGLGTFLAGVLTFFVPLAASAGVEYLIAIRVLQGLSEGITFPACQAILAQWVPPHERTKIPTLTISGCSFGIVIAFITSGLLADLSFLGGWPLVFYVCGLISCVWFTVWVIFVSSNPAGHRFITSAEKDYIAKCLARDLKSRKQGGGVVGMMDLPWKAITMSTAVWAVFISHFTFNWCNYTLLTSLPTYFNTVLGLNLRANGLLSAIPYVAQTVVQIVVGPVADTLRSKCGLKTELVRKLLDCSAHFFPGICIIAVGHIGCDTTAAIALLSTAVGLTGLTGGGFFVNLFDISPQYAGVIFGMSNTLATIPGIAGPYLTQTLIQDEPTVASWQIVFYISAALYFFSTIFYMIFAKATIQWWADPQYESKKKSTATKERF